MVTKNFDVTFAQPLVRKSGMTMIEALVAMLIFVIISSAVILITLQIMSANYSARLKNQGTAYAEQLLEQTKDYSMSQGYAKFPTTGCYVSVPDLSSPQWVIVPGVSSCPPTCSEAVNVSAIRIADQTVFYRYIRFADVTNSKKVTANVSWMDKGSCKSTVIDTYYYNL